MELPNLSQSHGLWKQHTPTLDPEPTPFLLIPHCKRQAHTMKKNKTGDGDRKRKDAERGGGGGGRGALALSPPPTEGGRPGRHDFLLVCSLHCFIARRSHRTHHCVLSCFLNEAFLKHFLLT